LKDEDDVGLPFDALDSDGPGELVHQAGSIDGEALECHSLGSDVEVDAFHGVEGLKRGDVEGVDASEDKNEGQDRITSGVVVEYGISIFDASGTQRAG
jgi:hypothetical protein